MVKRFFIYLGCAVVMCLVISCKNGSGYSSENYDLDSIFSSWERLTITLIEKVHPSDSSTKYYVGPNLPLYEEGEYIREELLKNRENLMRAVFPILSDVSDTMLVVEFYDMTDWRIYIYGGGKVYIYQFDSRNHLPCHVTINQTNISEEIGCVKKGFYRCYVQGPINDVSCTTLITKLGGTPKLEILALTINEVLH